MRLTDPFQLHVLIGTVGR